MRTRHIDTRPPPGVSILTAGMRGKYKEVWQATLRGISAEMAVVGMTLTHLAKEA
jgi:hypothetical protein